MRFAPLPQQRVSERGFVLPIVLSILLVITLLASSSTDSLRTFYKIEQSKNQAHIAHQRALTSLSSAESYLFELTSKPVTTFDINRDSLTPDTKTLWAAALSNYYLAETKDAITNEPLTHYNQNPSWWRQYANPVSLDSTNSGKAVGYMASEQTENIGYYIIEDFDDVVELTPLSHDTDYHRRTSSTLYAITVMGEFNKSANSRIQSYYVKNYY